MKYNSQIARLLNCFEIPFIIIDNKMDEVGSNLLWLDFCHHNSLSPKFSSFLSCLDQETKKGFLDFINNIFVHRNNPADDFVLSLVIGKTEYSFSIRGMTIELWKEKDKQDHLLLLFHESLSRHTAKIPTFKNSDRFMHMLLDSMPTAVIILDSAENIIFANPAFVNLGMNYYLAGSQMIPLEEIYPQSSIRQAFQKSLKAGETQYLHEQVTDARGQTLKQSFRIFPMKLKGQMIGAFAFIKDNTEVQANEARFLNNYRITLLGNLAGGVAHELNTPLGLARLATEMLLTALETGELDYQTGVQYLKQMIKSIDKMSTIVKQVVRFSRNDESCIKTSFDLNELIRDSIIMYGKLLKTDDISLELNLADSLPKLIGVSSQIQTVVTDLINNVRDSLANINVKTERKITISTVYRPELDCISFTVLDNGREMDVYLREKLFDSFFDPNSPETETKNGLGLGLSVSYGIIKNHGGIMTVDNAKNGGTQFSILLPVKESEGNEQ